MYSTFHCVLSRCSFHVSLSLLLIALETLLFRRFNFVFIKDLSLFSRSKEQTVTAENEEQYLVGKIT